MGFVAGETAVLDRFMFVFSFKRRTVMTLETEVPAVVLEKHGVVGSVGVMTDIAVTIGRRLVNDFFIKPEGVFVMAGITEIGTRFYEAQHADHPMRFMAGATIFIIERLVFHASCEIGLLVAIKAVTFTRESFSFFYLPHSRLVYNQKGKSQDNADLKPEFYISI